MHRYFAVITVCLLTLMQSNGAFAQKKSKAGKATSTATSASVSVQASSKNQTKVAPELKPGSLLDSAQLLIQPTYTSLLDALPRADKVYKLRLDENNLTSLANWQTFKSWF
jgi:hypothetical protein